MKRRVFAEDVNELNLNCGDMKIVLKFQSVNYFKNSVAILCTVI